VGRNKLKLVISAAGQNELRSALKSNPDPRSRDRIQAVQLATAGRHTHEEIAALIGRARSTIQEWINAYEAGGLAGLLARKKAPGKPSPIADPALQAQIRAGLRGGRWRTASHLATWLRQTHGIQRVARSMYYWLAKNRPVPRDGSSVARRRRSGRTGRGSRAPDGKAAKPGSSRPKPDERRSGR
jgi:transposase